MKITKKTINRWGWGPWEAAMRDAKQLSESGMDARCRKLGRDWIRSLERTRREVIAEAA